MSEPLSDAYMEKVARQAAEVVKTFGDDWELVYEPGAGEVSCRFEDDHAPFVGVYVEMFRTSQCTEGQDTSPVAQFLMSSIVVVPRLIGEVERLAAENARLDRRVGELTALLNNPDRLAEHLLDLRIVLRDADRDAEIDRLADGGEL